MGRGFCQKKKNVSASNTIAAIVGNMAGMDIDKKVLAQKTNINYRTLCMRLESIDSIGDMRLKELWAIGEVVKFNETQKMGML